jgi:hypothetical protein
LSERMTDRPPLEGRRDLWDASNVTRVVSCAPLTLPGLTLVSDRPPFRIYRNDTAWPRATWACGLEPLTEWEVGERLREGHYEGRRLLREQTANIRWRATLAADDRRQREAQYGLSDGEFREGSTWRYRLEDTTRENVAALIRDPAVEDTHGVDRERAQLAPPSEEGRARDQMLLGTARCDGDASIRIVTTDQPNGLVRAEVDAPAAGYAVFSEAYYPERHAYVDGREVPIWRTNLAFLSLPVPAGRHEIEIRYVPTSLYAGLATSAITVAIWSGAGWRRRRLAPPAAATTAAGR